MKVYLFKYKYNGTAFNAQDTRKNREIMVGSLLSFCRRRVSCLHLTSTELLVPRRENYVRTVTMMAIKKQQQQQRERSKWVFFRFCLAKSNWQRSQATEPSWLTVSLNRATHIPAIYVYMCTQLWSGLQFGCAAKQTINARNKTKKITQTKN